MSSKKGCSYGRIYEGYHVKSIDLTCYRSPRQSGQEGKILREFGKWFSKSLSTSKGPKH